MLSVESLREARENVEPERTPEPTAENGSPLPLRVLFWTCPPEVRIGREELLEAVGRPASWLYRHSAPSTNDRIPHQRLHGGLVFVVGEVRRWLREREEIVEAGPLDHGVHFQILGGGR